MIFLLIYSRVEISLDDLETYVKKMVLANAVKYDGTPSSKSVMGAIMGSRADLRSRSGEVKSLV